MKKVYLTGLLIFGFVLQLFGEVCAITIDQRNDDEMHIYLLPAYYLEQTITF